MEPHTICTHLRSSCVSVIDDEHHDLRGHACQSDLPLVGFEPRVGEHSVEIGTAGRQDVTVDREDTVIYLQTDKRERDMHRNRDRRPTRCYGECGKQFSTCRHTSGRKDCRLTRRYGNWGRHSFLPADRQAEIRTSYRQNVTVDREDTVIHLQTDKCEQDVHRNRDCRPT